METLSFRIAPAPATPLHDSGQSRPREVSILEEEWLPISDAARRVKNCRPALPIIMFAMAQKLHTYELMQAHVDAWSKTVPANRCSMHVSRAQKAFRRLLRKEGLQALFPKFDASKRIRQFSLFLKEMDPPLQADVSGIIADMKASAQVGNVRIGENLLSQFEALCGYAVNELGLKGVVSVDPLLTQDFLLDYVKWLARKCKRPAISNKLGGLHTVVINHERFKDKDFSWWSSLLKKVGYEPESTVKERSRSRGLRYKKLLTIIFKIRSHRMTTQNLSLKKQAWSLHDEALMALMVLHVWDAHLIRICKISGPSPNLFCLPVPEERPYFALTPAATKAKDENRGVSLWQFDFEKEWGIGAYGLVISQVFPILEEYLSERWRLINKEKGDPGTLFFRRDGGALTKSSLERLVGELTYQFAGKRVSPETIRNSWIAYWRVDHPKDYANIANVLMISLDSVLQRFDPDYAKARGRDRG